MPAGEKHLLKYNSNKELIGSELFDPKTTLYRDWLITITFYSAVHLIEKVFASVQFHSTSHINRDEDIMKFPILVPIAARYTLLEIQSKKARYQCRQFSPKDIEDALAILCEIEKVAL